MCFLLRRVRAGLAPDGAVRSRALRRNACRLPAVHVSVRLRAFCQRAFYQALQPDALASARVRQKNTVVWKGRAGRLGERVDEVERLLGREGGHRHCRGMGDKALVRRDDGVHLGALGSSEDEVVF